MIVNFFSNIYVYFFPWIFSCISQYCLVLNVSCFQCHQGPISRNSLEVDSPSHLFLAFNSSYCFPDFPFTSTDSSRFLHYYTKMMTLHCTCAWSVHKSLCATLVYTACLCGEICLFFKALAVYMTSLNIILLVPFSNLKRSVKVLCLASQVDKFTNY